MPVLTRRAKEAIKTALAMVIAFGIALAMDWDKPYWAGFAVAFISLPGIGQSLRKGATRMLGTLAAGVVALALVAAFPQDRWLFLIALSAWIALCAYKVQGERSPYFWQVGAFVSVIIIFDGGVNSLNAFQTTVERIQETGMGILVYTLVSVFLWPQSARTALDEVGPKLVALQLQIFRGYRATLRRPAPPTETHPLRMQEVQLVGQFRQALAGAEADNYDVWALRHQWQRAERLIVALGEAMERWRESFSEIRQLDIVVFLPTAGHTCDEVETRLEQIAAMLAGRAPDRTPAPASVELDTAEVRALNHFERAAVITARAQLNRIELLSRDLFACVANITGNHVEESQPRSDEVLANGSLRGGVLPDPERLYGVVRVLSGMWLAFLAWIYIDPPGHQAFVIFPVSLGLGLLSAPWLPVPKLFPPMILSALFAGAMYIFVMPQLSNYTELGMMIFLVTFLISYLFHTPQQGLSRAFGLALFFTVISVQNEQTYSFAGYANQTAMCILAAALLCVVAYIPTSPRPEKAFLRLVRRFFRQSEVVLSRLATDGDNERGVVGPANRWRYGDDMIRLAQRLEPWARAIDAKAFRNTSEQDIQSVVTSLQALAFRIKELAEARTYPQSDFMARELLDDVRAWRRVLQAHFERWAEDPGTLPADDPGELLARRLASLERCVSETFQRPEAHSLNAGDLENFYRLLGAYRGLSEAMIEHLRAAARIDWLELKEARF